MSPVLVPPVVPLDDSNNTREYPFVKALSGLNQTQVENACPIVIEGMVRYWAPELVLANPFICAKYATFCRSVMLPGMEAGLPVGTRLPVTPDASSKKAFGWNG
jgi:hypothetical protein